MNANKKIIISALAAAGIVVAGGSYIARMAGRNKAQDLSSVHTTAAAETSPVLVTEAASTEAQVTTAAEPQVTSEGTSGSGSGTASSEKTTEVIQVKPAYEVHMRENSFGNGNVSIQHPEISGMEDTALQQKINELLAANANSIVDLYPLQPDKDQMTVKCQLNYVDRNRISVIYTGDLQLSAIPAQRQITVEGAQVSQGAVFDTSPFNEAGHLKRKIFYTNTVDLKTGKSLNISDFVAPETLGVYTLSEEAVLVGNSNTDTAAVRKYFSDYPAEYFTALLKTGDFRENMQSWPYSFCYEKSGNIIYSVPVPGALGDYVLLKFEPHTK